MLKATEKIWHNGKLIDWFDAKIHVLAHVLHYGSSVFEGIRCYATPSGPGARSACCLTIPRFAREVRAGKQEAAMRPTTHHCGIARDDRGVVRLTIRDAVLQHTNVGPHDIDDKHALQAHLKSIGIDPLAFDRPDVTVAQLQFKLFEEVVEEKLWAPTFIIDHPVEVSPLARAADSNPSITERFELYITGREIANGFSELNDPEEQAARFADQAKAKDAGDEEAMYFDADYIRALEYGLPPTGGCGIGIDRLIMLLTDSANIRDIILFPALRREI